MQIRLKEVAIFVPKNAYAELIQHPIVSKLNMDTPCWLFRNGNYHIIYLEDGTKIRFNGDTALIPHRPECIDLTVSTYCENECPFCYMSCTKDGVKIPKNIIDDPYFANFIYELWEGTEVAINVNSLRGRDDIVRLNTLLYAMPRDVFVNITIHEKDFYENAYLLSARQSDGRIHGIGVSVGKDTDIEKIIWTIEKYDIKNVVLHVIPQVIHPDKFSSKYRMELNVLLLGYKELGRGTECDISLSDNIDLWKLKIHNWYENCQNGYERYSINSISFDGLALDQLNVREWMDSDLFKTIYAGNEGAYSMYIDLVNHKYARSSIDKEQYDWGTKSLKEMFEDIRTAPLGTEGGINNDLYS